MRIRPHVSEHVGAWTAISHVLCDRSTGQGIAYAAGGVVRGCCSSSARGGGAIMKSRDRPPEGQDVSRTHRKPSWELCCRLADNVKRYRPLRGYTQHQLSRQCGFARSYVGDVEQATEILPSRILRRLLPVSGVERRNCSC